MLAIVVRRMAWALPVALFATLIVFSLLHLAPGDPAVRAAGGIEASPEAIEQMREALNLNDPLVVQYWHWVTGAVMGDLGTSLFSSLPVADAIAQAVPVSLSLSFLAITLAVLVGVPLGIAAGVKPAGLVERLIAGTTSIGIAIPNFFIGVLLVVLIARNNPVFPATGYASLGDGFGEWLRHLVLPAIALSVATAAEIARYLRNSLQSELQQDYVTMARSKGLPEWLVVAKHALKPAAIPVVTVLGLQLRHLISGTVVVEVLFGLPGLGALGVQSVFGRDYPIIQGVMLSAVAVVLVVNLLVDITYSYLDPRVRST